jgi:hypothetical protein
MLTVIEMDLAPLMSNDARSTAARRRSPSVGAADALVSVWITANSSPPYRQTRSIARHSAPGRGLLHDPAEEPEHRVTRHVSMGVIDDLEVI